MKAYYKYRYVQLEPELGPRGFRPTNGIFRIFTHYLRLASLQTTSHQGRTLSTSFMFAFHDNRGAQQLVYSNRTTS